LITSLVAAVALGEARVLALPCMNDTDNARLLAADEPAALALEREHGASPFLLICDHASRRIPRALGDLGVSEADRQRHVAWDIGAAGVATRLAAALDAFAILQNYSRLVIDCNRPLDAPGSIVARSEATDIPGNANIDATAAAARVREIFLPYHARIAGELDRRVAQGKPTILISVHSFTPVYHGVARPWQIGMLYGRDARVAHRLLAIIRAEGRWNVGDNEPYAVTATTDYAIPVHCETRGIAHVGLEIRQDLIEQADGQDEWATRIAGWLSAIAPDFTA
jgi:predicted N-formylglutamate amidohydrolase